MKLIKGKTIAYDSDEEFYSRQVLGARPHDNNRIVKTCIAEAIRFLMLGGKLDYTEPPAEKLQRNTGKTIIKMPLYIYMERL